MNAAEIIRNLINVMDKSATDEKPEEAHLANAPDEHTIDAKTMFATGNDMHHPKDPADIRTNAPSMYPGYQAEKP